MYAQRRSEAPILPSNYSGNAFRYPPPTPVPPLSREVVEEDLAGGEQLADGALFSRSEERCADGERAAVDDGACLSDGVASAAAASVASPADSACPGPVSRLSFGAWRGILQGLGGEELLLLGVLLLVSGEESGTVLPLCLLLLLLCG